ncbi:Phosphate-binding protein PstS precursor [Caulifigura coniformis]|uniref:Phosphate-binding protein n=1 Tax=Caulifigura coniformis TaxID=2527983 RepID=A0A517SGP9_9PLAN|nr:PstS family phosphate ABC transporter substrate-binding protein [Caulifigura coniformis]QDT55294.1 Phosphate-binding protein PstS precursor [Caulifigura coniformis]
MNFGIQVRRALIAVVGACVISACGCTVRVADAEGRKASSGDQIAGTILIDGSSTVYPITQAISEAFSGLHQDVQAPVGSGGTSSGFKKLIQGEIDIAGASRPITAKESDALKAKGIEVLELEVALDGISIVVNPGNDWCSALTVKQLHQIWNPDNGARRWRDLDPAWPETEIKLFGAGTNSGTFEYFTEVVNGKKGVSRSDYSQSEDDNQLVIGIAGDQHSLGYFGYSYFDENRDRLKIVKIAAGDDIAAAIEPSKATIEGGTYTPLSRPVYIYVSRKSLTRREVAEFVRFYLSDEGQKLVETAHCIPLHADRLKEQRKRLDEAIATSSLAAN